ncbi:helix-turn-helix transcriptional regulator [Vannielia litorea]|uniref:helix-turn-helix transcriptional regulator n=1 Tax=Vannielia TaxID=2813041 RepID=UPI001C978D3C|nr:helix-turn-helix transcriptional regulator [Vannielia litorea]MBY6048944.1 helix-turn-helix transcriptional regulator [Vannielia litorea]MBY6076358.1 helix-turn-helix transcriptional regulator [Vannielia litorea]MBY6154578.1 helix-turn-helix transcriptional regulator [Vannielia litorea]
MSEITNFRGQTTAALGGDEMEAAVERLISRVGERVRKARELRGLPRRVVSELSGVSPRYLAQLEAGEGNISIGLLKRVAVALDHRIEWLVGEDDPWTSEAMRVADLFSSSPADVRTRVLELLTPEPPARMRGQRICLIGLRGAGKSTLGAALGARLGLPFIELNREIEEQSGMPVNEVMALYGQEGYRKLEAQAVSRITATHESLILAVAGGIVAEPDTYKSLLAQFHTVWLKASPEEHMGRVRAQGDTRPMAGNPEAMEQLKSILRSREALYERAEAQLDTSGQPIEATLDALEALVRERGFLTGE